MAIVNEKMAHDYWPGGEAIGKRIQLPGEKQMRQIVGIARTANYTAWGEPPQLCVYVPLEQNYSDGMIAVRAQQGRSATDPDAGSARDAVLPGRKFWLAVRTNRARDHRSAACFRPRMGVALLSVFGLLALGLASIGLIRDHGVFGESAKSGRSGCAWH